MSLPECVACPGRRQVRFQRGLFASSRDCSLCAGTGVRPEARCTRCAGTGGVRVTQTLTVTRPAGVADGAVRTIAGAGEQTARGHGALHVHVKVRPHPLFTRNGADLECEVPVSFPQAALGAELEIPTLEGKVTMKLPAGTQPGRVFRLRGKGLPAFGGVGKGDQLVRISVEVPGELSERQRALLTELGESFGAGGTHPQQQTFLDKLRALFG
jgi:molecular chaperone DnaJ